MGNTTDVVGHIDINPPLNEHEIEILSVYGLVASGEDIDELSRSADQPRSRCEWSVCSEGCCLSFNDADEPSGIVTWLRYLMSQFLKPTAKARGREGFEHCTFNHTLDGIVVGCRRDTDELAQVTVRKNRVTMKLLRAGTPEYFGYPVVPHETSDHERRRRGGRTLPRESRTVIDLDSRRAGL